MRHWKGARNPNFVDVDGQFGCYRRRQTLAANPRRTRLCLEWVNKRCVRLAAAVIAGDRRNGFKDAAKVMQKEVRKST